LPGFLASHIDVLANTRLTGLASRVPFLNPDRVQNKNTNTGSGEQVMRRSHKGFSLIELLIVVSIILIIAAIAIPNLLRAKLAANEASAVGSLRTITTAAILYSTTYGTGFPRTLASLGGSTTASSTSADLIDSVLASGTKSGYSFTYTPSAAISGFTNSYTLTATPIAVGTTGQRMFFTDQSGVIRANTLGSGANANSTPIG
jgi:type IV pilus assembly protein PilA